jgi:enolase
LNTTISRLYARRIWDSRGRPTVETNIELVCGAHGRGIAPAGASRGSREAVDLRDGGEILQGFGVEKAVAAVNGPIASSLKGIDALDQEQVDRILIDLDGTPNKARLGGNATVATSMAALHCAANASNVPLWRYLAGNAEVRMPLPEIQIFGGGAHAGRRIDIQDLMVMPIGAENFDEALVMVANVYQRAGLIMDGLGRLAGLADEGGWWPNFASNEEALDVLSQAIDGAGYADGEVVISLDIAASEFGSRGKYKLSLDQKQYDTSEWLEILLGWVRQYPILSVEDPVAEDDAEGMRAFTAAVGNRVQIIGDDYLVTNASRVEDAVRDSACNAVLIKPNQAGTITQTRQALDAAKRAGWGTIISARSGETEDTTIVHLAVGWDAGQLKVGSFARSERMAKWNEALRIEAQLGAAARFAGRAVLPGEQTREEHA